MLYFFLHIIYIINIGPIYIYYTKNDHCYSDGLLSGYKTKHDHFSGSLEITIHSILPSISTKCGWVEMIPSLVCYTLFSWTLEI